MTTYKQNQILARVKQNKGQITKAEAVDLVGDNFHNADHHVGEILSRMVSSGLLIRIKPGLFKPGTGKKSPPVDAGQTELF